MNGEQTSVRLIREALETMLSQEMASSVLFDALEAYEQVPESPEDVLLLLHGPLRAVLGDRLDSEQADATVNQVELMLAVDEDDASADEVFIEVEADEPDDDFSMARDVTTTVPLETAVVRVLVVAASEAFFSRLRSALGKRSFELEAIRDATTMRAAAGSFPPPSVVVIDGSDFAPIEPFELTQTLALLPSTAVRAVWAPELPYGRSVAHSLAASGMSVVTLAREEGLAPLLDLVRSRRRQDRG